MPLFQRSIQRIGWTDGCHSSYVRTVSLSLPPPISVSSVLLWVIHPVHRSWEWVSYSVSRPFSNQKLIISEFSSARISFPFQSERTEKNNHHHHGHKFQFLRFIGSFFLRWTTRKRHINHWKVLFVFRLCWWLFQFVDRPWIEGKLKSTAK